MTTVLIPIAEDHCALWNDRLITRSVMNLLSLDVLLQFHAQYSSTINRERLVTRSGDGYFDAGPHESLRTESRPSSPSS